jgi:hypothetical protein
VACGERHFCASAGLTAEVSASAVTGTRKVGSVLVRFGYPNRTRTENKNSLIARRSFLDLLPSMVCVCPDVTECVMERSNSAIVVAMQRESDRSAKTAAPVHRLVIVT